MFRLVIVPDDTSNAVADVDVLQVGGGKPEVEKVLDELVPGSVDLTGRDIVRLAGRSSRRC